LNPDQSFQASNMLFPTIFLPCHSNFSLETKSFQSVMKSITEMRLRKKNNFVRNGEPFKKQKVITRRWW